MSFKDDVKYRQSFVSELVLQHCFFLKNNYESLMFNSSLKNFDILVTIFNLSKDKLSLKFDIVL